MSLPICRPNSTALVLGMLGKDADAVPVYRKTLELKPALYWGRDLNLGIILLRDKQPGGTRCPC